MTDDWAKEKARELLRRLDTPGSAFSLEARGLPLLIAFASEAFRRGEESMQERSIQAIEEACLRARRVPSPANCIDAIRSLPVGGNQ